MSTRRSAPSKPARAATRVVAVEAEVAGEVVPRAARHRHEGEVALDRDARDGAERAVAAGHAERVGIRATGELDEVVVGLEHAHLDAAVARRCLELLDGGRPEPERGLTNSTPAISRATLVGVGPRPAKMSRIGPWYSSGSLPIIDA